MKQTVFGHFTRRSFLSGGVLVAGSILLHGAGRRAIGQPRQPYSLAPESLLPMEIRHASPEIVEAYRFAIANRETLKYIPCYCGCGAEGHTSNASRYVKDVSTPGNLVFDRMSLG
jgi:hypothetical protein